MMLNFRKRSLSKIIFIRKKYYQNSKKRILLYVPTFRDTDRYSRKTPVSWSKLNNILKENKATMLVLRA